MRDQGLEHAPRHDASAEGDEDAGADDWDGEPIGNAVGETVECGDGHCDADETHDYAR